MQLKAFEKNYYEVNEEKLISLKLSKRDFQIFKDNDWQDVKGEFRVCVCSSTADINQHCSYFDN